MIRKLTVDMDHEDVIEIKNEDGESILGIGVTRFDGQVAGLVLQLTPRSSFAGVPISIIYPDMTTKPVVTKGVVMPIRQKQIGA